ncbi:hypothetical protein ABZX66_30030 [Micromonospora aurantiaca]|uniref:hypothetical protein n=1 Tax=Micromonospora aurantiaca (nom. illeg.) TaxID=47850 RepID=UPI0033BEEAC5
MAWEWVGPVMTGAVGISVGITGIVATYKTGKQGRQHAEVLARQQNEHDAALAKEQRDQQRRSEAYVELLTMVERVGQWASMVRPMLDTNPPRPVPPLPELSEQARSNALVGAYASPAVKERYQAWRKVVMEAIGAVEDIEFALANPDAGLSHIKPRRELDFKHRPAEGDARRALADQIAAELGGSTPGFTDRAPAPREAGGGNERGRVDQRTRRSNADDRS